MVKKKGNDNKWLNFYIKKIDHNDLDKKGFLKGKKKLWSSIPRKQRWITKLT
jgi:hypothetical protein